MIHLKVIQPDKIKIEGDFPHIIIPGVDGDFGVLQGHTPFFTKIRPGILTLYNQNSKKTTEYTIHDGFVTVDKDEVVIVCDVIEKSDELDSKRAHKAKVKAEKFLKNDAANKEIDFRRAEFALKRALVRLDLSQSKQE